MNIQLITSSADSWIIPYGYELQSRLIEKGHRCSYLIGNDDVQPGDILVFLSYEKIFNKLSLNKHNLIIHESDLPKGKGMSPLTWQILEGNNRIPITLFEAAEKVDSGVIYKKTWIEFEGNELLPEIKEKQGLATIDLVVWFIDNYPSSSVGEAQAGESSFYKRRTPADSLIDISRPIGEQFNLLRVCDNERYPAYFELNGYTYLLKIEKILK